MKITLLYSLILIVLFFCSREIPAQSGGTYELTQTVMATGGTSSGGSYSLVNTDGQPVAGGALQNGPYSLYIGFWSPPNLTPTAALVNLGGRITTADGQGIRNVRLTLTGADGAVRTAQTTTFGYYRFTDVRAGEVYILTILSKRFVFSNPTRILNVAEELTDLDFVAEPAFNSQSESISANEGFQKKAQYMK